MVVVLMGSWWSWYYWVADGWWNCFIPSEVLYVVRRRWFLKTFRPAVRCWRKTQRPEDSLQMLNIEDDWKLTTDGERFLLYDNGPNSESRVVMFDTDKHYIIIAHLATSAGSCVYAFLENKHQDTYEELFTELTKRVEKMGHCLDPELVVTDFELAVAKAIKAVIGPHVSTKKLFFHLTQSTWRKEGSKTRLNAVASI